MPESFGVDVTIAGVYYPRIHAKASGAFSSVDVDSKFLRFLLPVIPADFDGQIDSKTKTYRLAIGISGAGDSPLSFGFYQDKIECKSTFCGVHAKSN